MIRLLVLDVDGTMTDGGVYYDATGNELKKFAIKDGAGLVLARTAGIRVMICTGRECEAVRRRAADLKITDIYQDVGKKAAFLRPWRCAALWPARRMPRRRCGRAPTISAPSAAARVPSAELWRRSCAGTDAGTTL